MSSWSILIVDDEAEASEDPESRCCRYKKMEGTKYDHKFFELAFAPGPDEARQLLKTGVFDLVLLDVKLPGWGDDDRGTLFKEFLRLADDRFPVGLVSSGWDYSSMELVRDFLVSNPAVQLPLLFTFRDFEGESFAAISTQIVTFVRRRRGHYALDVEPGKPIHILHLSDLHFGAGDTAATLATEATIRVFFDKIKSEWPSGPHIVVVTGDIGNTGHPSDYALAERWFAEFAKAFSWTLPSPRIMIIPGNHDYCIPLAGAEAWALDPEKRLKPADRTAGSRMLSSYAMQPFKEFAAKISFNPRAWNTSPVPAWVEFGFVEYGIVFSGFNTSSSSGEMSWPRRAIDDDQIAVVQVAFEQHGEMLRRHDPIHISLSHHSPVGYPKVHEPIEDSSAYVEKILNGSHPPRLLMHGHQHFRWGALPDGHKYMCVCAPTPSKTDVARPADSPRGVNLLTLVREGSRVSSVGVQSLIRLEAGWTVIPLPNHHSFSMHA